LSTNLSAWPGEASRPEHPTGPGDHARTFKAVHVLDADPDLGSALSPARLAEARSRLVARVVAVPQGPWTDAAEHAGGPEQLGLLILDGVVSRELLMDDNVSAELLGQGDLIRPWQTTGPSRLLQAEVRWTVLHAARFAAFGPGFARALAQFPEVNSVLIDRVTERANRVALGQAISQLNGVDRRVLALFWHLAERWGRMTSNGVLVPLALPHRIIAQLVGARRPTVSTAIVRLVERGVLERRNGGTWVLHGEPVGLPTAQTARIVELRRNRFQHADDGAHAALGGAPGGVTL
jgi:CRP/FNR family transcriptional regulator, cyclic AMP receptor protein